MELDGTIVGKFGRAGKAAGRVRDHPPDGLPRSGRHLHRRDQQLALAEDPAQAAGRQPDECERRRSAMTRTAQGFVAAAVLALGGVAGRRRAPCPEIAFDTNADLLQDAERRLRRRGRRRRRQFEGPDLRLHAHRSSLRHARRQPHVLARRLAAVPVRSDRQVRARARAGRLRLQRRDRAARRSAGQRLDDRRRRQPGGEVRHRGARRAGARPKARDDRRAAARSRRTGARGRRRAGSGGAPAGAGRRPDRAARRRTAGPATGTPGSTLQPADRRRVGLAPATSTSPTASAPTTASPSSTRTAASSSTGARPGPGRGSSTA